MSIGFAARPLSIPAQPVAVGVCLRRIGRLMSDASSIIIAFEEMLEECGGIRKRIGLSSPPSAANASAACSIIAIMSGSAPFLTKSQSMRS